MDHGEVLTGKREVNAMLDLVKQETERIESRFLEPACGNGNFLTAILERKLSIVEKRYGKSQLEFERYAGPDHLPASAAAALRRPPQIRRPAHPALPVLPEVRPPEEDRRPLYKPSPVKQ